MIKRMNDDQRESWEERAAILEHDHGLETQAAEALAMCFHCRLYDKHCPVAPAKKPDCINFLPGGLFENE